MGFSYTPAVPARSEYMQVQDAFQDRRSDYDVTNTVQVSSPHSVCGAVRGIFTELYPNVSFDPLWLAFHDFARLFGGGDPDYHAVDTTYHDMQHTLDMALALARLIAGYEASVEPQDRLGSDRAMFGLICALFHDSGYLRHRTHDHAATNGAEFTKSHVTRSGQFIESYLPRIGHADFVPVATRVVHFTGYEMALDHIELEDPLDCMLGHLLGTADLLAQLSDRCYLEKCRDRLYPEFVLGNVAVEEGPDGARIHYHSGRELLKKTLQFYRSSAEHRLEHSFNRAYRYAEAFFGNKRNPYMQCIRKNLDFLQAVLDSDRWDKLRRRPPCGVPDPDGEARLMALALRRLREISESQRAAARKKLAGPALSN